MTTELCAYSIEACETARRAGVARVELCASPYEGGTTPSAAAIRMARRIEGLQLSVMIRPRGGDFLYDDAEFRQMLEEVRFARECGADGVVFGLLTPDGRVDTARTAALVAEAGPMQTTFHRAFDMTCDLSDALEEVVRAGCTRILTSGGRNTASEGIGDLRALVVRAAGRIEIMAGSGVNPSNVRNWPRRVSMPSISARAACGRAAWHTAIPRFRWAAVPACRSTLRPAPTNGPSDKS